MSLKEYSSRSPYGVAITKRKKQPAYVAGYGLQLVDVKDDCHLVQQSRTPNQSDFEVICIPNHGSRRSSRGVKVLNGKGYVLVGEIVAGGKTEIVFRRAAVDDSIDEGTIDYNRLAANVTRRQASGRANRVARAVVDAEIQLENVHPLREVMHAVADKSPRTVIISITGSLVEKTAKQFVIDWYGGGQLTVERSHAEGDWHLLQLGQWFEATVSRRMTGEVVRAMLIGTIDEPEGFSEEELTTSYSSIPAAQLDSVK